MSIFDVIGLCVRSLIKRKLRTFLTLLGVIIGTSSIILMMSLGMATEAQFAELIDTMGADMMVIQVMSAQWGRPTPGGGWEQPDFVPDLDDAAIDSFSRLPGVTVASPLIRGTVYFRSGRYVMEAWNVTGIRPEALVHMGYTLEQGRFLEEGDGFAAVFGALAELDFYVPGSNEMPRGWNLWGMDLDDIERFVDVYNDPIRISYDRRLAPSFWSSWGMVGEDDMGGIELEDAFSPIRSFDLEVVGVLAMRNESQPWREQQVYMDIYVLQELDWLRREADRELHQEGGWFSAIRGARERVTYDNAFVRVESIDHTHNVATAINEMGFWAEFPGEQIDMQRRQQQNIRVLLTAIAAISLLVAAINIANTMITSVTERTREIGVMKVIGAAIKDIRRMFLLEAVMIGILGGIFGIGLSLIGSYVMNNFEIEFLESLRPPPEMGMMGGPETEVIISLITPSLLLLALGVAAGVGLVAGYFPARRATKLSALAAIRTD